MKNLIKKLLLIYYRLKFGSFGSNSWFSPFGTYLCTKKILVGSNVYVGKGAYLSASEGLEFGDGVTVGPELMVMGGDHKIDDVGKYIYQMKSGGENSPVVIEDDVWIGARVTLLKGVKVGEGAVIGAGSIVTKDIPPYTIFAGNPARKIGYRYQKEQLEEHHKLVDSRYDLKELVSIYE